MILAGIDIGTNTLRLLIAETTPQTFKEITSDRRVTRLGQGLDLSGRLSPEAEERTLYALIDFSDQIRRYAAFQTAAIGTSALRNASNSPAFIHEVKKRTGLDVRVIPGAEEARLTLLGVARMLEQRGGRKKRSTPASAIIIDIGGGSTEIIMTRPGGEPLIASLPLGAVYLTDRFIKNDPPWPEELFRLRQAIRTALDTFAETVRRKPDSVLIGTAGTITTLTAIDQGLLSYDPERINHAELTRERIEDIIVNLGVSTIEERRTIRGLEQGREDIILAGAFIAQEIMDRFGYASMLVSDWGLREGIVLDLYEKIAALDGAVE